MVRSKRLWGPSTVGTTSALVYTCPAGETAILKQLTFVNNAITASTILLRLNGTAAAQNLIFENLPGSGALEMHDLFVVLEPGDTIRCTASQASVISCGFGAELEGVAD